MLARVRRSNAPSMTSSCCEVRISVEEEQIMGGFLAERNLGPLWAPRILETAGVGHWRGLDRRRDGLPTPRKRSLTRRAVISVPARRYVRFRSASNGGRMAPRLFPPAL